MLVEAPRFLDRIAKSFRELYPVRAWKERGLQKELAELVKSTSDRLVEEVTTQEDYIDNPYSRANQFLATYEKDDRLGYEVWVKEVVNRWQRRFEIDILGGSFSQQRRSLRLVKDKSYYSDSKGGTWTYTIAQDKGLATMQEQLAFLQAFNQASLVSQ